MARRKGIQGFLSDAWSFVTEQVDKARDRLFGTGEDEPPLPPEPEPEPEPEIIEEVEIIEVQDEIEEIEAEEFYEDDFEAYLEELRAEAERAEQTTQIITISQFLSGGGDIKRLRKIRYATETDARNFLVSSGLRAFSEIVFDERSDTFGIVVYDSPGAKQ